MLGIPFSVSRLFENVPNRSRFWGGIGLLLVLGLCATAQDPMLPASLSESQQEKLKSFLKEQNAPITYVPKNARIGDTAPPKKDYEIVASKEKPIKQYTVQITPHRITPDESTIAKADVYFYRPNPEKGKQGITIKHTIDLETGKSMGEPEVLTKAHTPISREELSEAVALVQSKSEAVKQLYKGREVGAVRWEYLQMKINRKSEQFEPGDRVIRLVFTANPTEEEQNLTPVRVLVNITKDQVLADDR